MRVALVSFLLFHASGTCAFLSHSNFATSTSSTTSYKQQWIHPILTMKPLWMAADSNSQNDSDSQQQLLEAKLQVLEDVVLKLNVTKTHDQEEIQSLTSQLASLEEDLAASQADYEAELQRQSGASTDKENTLQQKLTELQEQRDNLIKQHEQELKSLERKLTKQAQLEQDTLQQKIRQETKEWRQQKEQEWQESLEIATASVAAAETREQDLQAQLDDLELRYQQEASDYKTELDALQKEWKLENKRLETEAKRWRTEVAEAKKERDQETATLMEQLEVKTKQLETELATAKEQMAMQRLQFNAQQQAQLQEFETQREKERNFHAEAMRLLRRENKELKEKQGLLRRVFRFFLGRGKGPLKRTRASTI